MASPEEMKGKIEKLVTDNNLLTKENTELKANLVTLEADNERMKKEIEDYEDIL